ncbi:hypothetical protein B0H11DRAFT_1924341 [Mycena galericulata]|nr:hypothetical protein B0H11DRAFT_1924341 [Mycena galericulata]
MSPNGALPPEFCQVLPDFMEFGRQLPGWQNLAGRMADFCQQHYAAGFAQKTSPGFAPVQQDTGHPRRFESYGCRFLTRTALPRRFMSTIGPMTEMPSFGSNAVAEWLSGKARARRFGVVL